jgi:nucleoside-diphosphate-sugar epimerase
MRPHLFCFGFGYCASRLAAALRADGADIELSGTTRTGARAGVEGLDVRLHRFDGAAPLDQAEALLAEITHVLVSVPPGPAGDPVLRLHAGDLHQARRLQWLGYLSTTGVYGDAGGGWIDEDTPPRPDHDGARARLAAEDGWRALGRELAVPVRVFRLAGIYGPGPGRNAIDRVAAGVAQRIVKPGMVFNRIHVDDIVATLRASIERTAAGEGGPDAVYNVADDRPLPPQDAIVRAAALLGVEPPPEIPHDDPSLSPFVRSFYLGCARVRNDRIKASLGVRLRHPDVLAGLDAIAATQVFGQRG